MVKAFILDLDGTLIDSHDAHVRAFKSTLNNKGYYTTSRELKKYFGLQEEDILKELFPSMPDEVLNGIMAEKRQKFIDGAPLVKLKKCALNLLKELNSKGCVALATGCHISEVNAVINELNLASYFKFILTSYDVQRPKPAPDILLALVRMLGVKKSDCVYIGDTVYDAMTAESAGIKFIGVNEDSEQVKAFRALGVAIVHHDLCSISSSL